MLPFPHHEDAGRGAGIENTTMQKTPLARGVVVRQRRKRVCTALRGRRPERELQVLLAKQVPEQPARECLQEQEHPSHRQTELP